MSFTFDVTQIWPQANTMIQQLLPVVYVVVGLGVGAYVLRKIRALF